MAMWIGLDQSDETVMEDSHSERFIFAQLKGNVLNLAHEL